MNKLKYLITLTAAIICINSNAQDNNKNPLLGTWSAVSCIPVKDDPCARNFGPNGMYSKVIFKSKHMEFANGDVLPITYIIDDGEVIVNSEGMFNAEKFTFSKNINETTLHFRNNILGNARVTYKKQ